MDDKIPTLNQSLQKDLRETPKSRCVLYPNTDICWLYSGESCSSGPAPLSSAAAFSKSSLLLTLNQGRVCYALHSQQMANVWALIVTLVPHSYERQFCVILVLSCTKIKHPFVQQSHHSRSRLNSRKLLIYRQFRCVHYKEGYTQTFPDRQHATPGPALLAIPTPPLLYFLIPTLLHVNTLLRLPTSQWGPQRLPRQPPQRLSSHMYCLGFRT